MKDRISVRIWLLLLEEGGRWTSAELASRMGETVLNVNSATRWMVREGVLVRYEKTGPGHFVTYGVTLACKAPAGITLQQLAALGAMRIAP